MDHLGASESAATMHKSPFMNRLTLMKTKLGMEPQMKPNAAMARGSMLEETVRQMCEVRLKERLPSKTLQSKLYPHLVAQIDGFGEREQIEIKCPFSEAKFNEMAEAIPLHYQIQMQHQMLVTGRKSVIFALYFEARLRLFRYESCPDLQAEVLNASYQFLEDLQQARRANERQNNPHEKNVS